MSDFKTSIQFVAQNPLPVVGFLLIGLSGRQSFVVLRRLLGGGYRWRDCFPMWPYMGTTPIAHLYLKARKQNGWSPWPAYLIWIFLVVGVAALVAGLFRLSN